MAQVEHAGTDDAARFYFSPRRTVTGVGCLSVISDEVKRLGGTRVLLATDAGVRAAGIVDRVLGELAGSGATAEVFDGIQANPTMANVLAGVEAIEQLSGLVIVGVGGGSVLDAAKMIGAVAVNGGPVQKYDGIDQIPQRMLPFIAVNTTAGTGSDVTRWAVITDTERQIKMAIGDENIMPDVAIDDPLLTVGLPPTVTAGTGMDAFTHALEGYVGKFQTPLTDGLAIAAIELIASALERAYDDGSDVEAREQMMYAQTAAGLAFENAGVGNVHAMAHQLGAVYDMPHGLSNAIILPFVMEYNLPVCERKFARVARAMGVDTSGMDDHRAACSAVETVVKLNEAVGIPSSLAGTPARSGDIDMLVEKAVKDLGAGTNPRSTSAAEMRDIYERVFAGRLEYV
jgi:alcohol dehydrogenase